MKCSNCNKEENKQTFTVLFNALLFSTVCVKCHEEINLVCGSCINELTHEELIYCTSCNRDLKIDNLIYTM